MASEEFSRLAASYAASRPTYPAALYDYLATLTPRRGLAWDCATGNGQAALGLARHFERVIATDAAVEQLRHATGNESVGYAVAAAEAAPLADRSVDLITVAEAVHWFDLDAFYAEASRVLRPGGVLALWGYYDLHVAPEMDGLLAAYNERMGPYFPGAGWHYLYERYATLPLPGVELVEAPAFAVEMQWTRRQISDYHRSWSARQVYMREHGTDPLDELEAALDALWSETEPPRTVTWPLYLRVTRLAD